MPTTPKQLNPKPKSSVGRKCTVCAHAEVDKINSLIAEGVSFRNISERFPTSKAGLSRHSNDCLKLDLQVLVAEKKVERAISHYEEITEQLKFAKDLRISAREYLSDENGRIVLIPRSDEVEVVYLDHKDLFMGQPRRKRAKLDAILEEIFVEGAKQADKWSIKHVDIRSFALDAIKTVDIVLDKIAKLGGLYQQDAPNDKEFRSVADSMGVAVALLRCEQPTEDEITDFVDYIADKKGWDKAELREKVFAYAEGLREVV